MTRLETARNLQSARKNQPINTNNSQTRHETENPPQNPPGFGSKRSTVKRRRGNINRAYGNPPQNATRETLPKSHDVQKIRPTISRSLVKTTCPSGNEPYESNPQNARGDQPRNTQSGNHANTPRAPEILPEILRGFVQSKERSRQYQQSVHEPYERKPQNARGDEPRSTRSGNHANTPRAPKTLWGIPQGFV